MLSKQIVRLRKMNGMSQSQLAKALDVSPSTIGMYEQGRRVPTLDIIIAMAQLFEVSLDYLITGTESCYSKATRLAPSDYTISSTEKVWWQCTEGHEWQATINYRTRHNQPCPVCAKSKDSNAEEEDS